MSVHLYVCAQDRMLINHPDWEPLFRSNGWHKDFVRGVFKDLPRNTINIGGPGDIELVTRPTDFAAWREAIAAHPGFAESNLTAMVDILEREPNYWLYVSQ